MQLICVMILLEEQICLLQVVEYNIVNAAHFSYYLSL